ncbi:MAG TPA: DMT family transporter [Mycobacteriales bacterium]|nr:DMT family transporter [Mycobacteriales bacterium]
MTSPLHGTGVGTRPAPRPVPVPLSPGTTLALGAAGVSGALVAAQQRINGQLGVDLQDALLAALVSFTTGLVAVVLVVLARPAARRALAAVRDVPWWCRLGGLGGATLVAVGAAATPQIGVALLTVGLVAGQTTGGLVVDRVGLVPGGSHLLTLPRVAGAVLCFVAVALGSLGRDARDADPVLLVLVVIAGFLIAVQQALNGRVRRTTGDAAVATLVNFVVGTAALGLGFALAAAARGLPAGNWPGPERWYLYLGGPIGAGFVAVAAVVVRRVGVLRLGLAVIAGQLVGALVLDLLLPATGRPVAAATLLGAALTLVAVGISGLGVRRA